MRVQFKSHYDDDINLFEDRAHRIKYALLLIIALVIPWLVSSYYVGEVTSVLIWSLAGLGLMLTAGHTGQISLSIDIEDAIMTGLKSTPKQTYPQRDWFVARSSRNDDLTFKNGPIKRKIDRQLKLGKHAGKCITKGRDGNGGSMCGGDKGKIRTVSRIGCGFGHLRSIACKIKGPPPGHQFSDRNFVFPGSGDHGKVGLELRQSQHGARQFKFALLKIQLVPANPHLPDLGAEFRLIG